MLVPMPLLPYELRFKVKGKTYIYAVCIITFYYKNNNIIIFEAVLTFKRVASESYSNDNLKVVNRKLI